MDRNKTRLSGGAARTWVLAGLFLFASPRWGMAQVVASDNADNAAYAPQPTPNWLSINGGYGYGPWTRLSGALGGGTYMEGVGVNNQQVEGNYSFALEAGSGTFAVSRPLANPLVKGEFTILTRFNLVGSGPNLIGLRAGNSTNSFGTGELLAFGLINSNELSYLDGGGQHVLNSGDARGAVWNWDVKFDAGAGRYSASVTNLSGGFSAIFGGALGGSNTTVGSFAVLDSSTGLNQNLIYDLPSFLTNYLAPPIVLTCASNITVAATSAGGTTVYYTSSAIGGCGGLGVWCTPGSGSTFPIGTTPRTCTATDYCGTGTSCVFTITVVAPPIVLTCASNINVWATSSNGATIYYTSSAIGGCGQLGVWCTPGSGSTFPIGTTPITCTATDYCGTVTSCVFTITVTAPPIVLTCASNITVNAASSSGTTIYYTSSAIGGCPGLNVTCSPPSGTTFPIGTSLITCTATDGCGSITNCFFFISVLGPEIIVVPSSLNRQIIISWLAAFTNYNLMESPDLTPASWKPSTYPVTNVNGTNSVTLPQPLGQMFFRLSGH